MDLQTKLVNDGYAQAYASPEKPYLPPWAIWKNQAYGVTAEPITIVYNRKLVPPADVPRTHADLIRLLRAKRAFYRGRVATYDPVRSSVGYLYMSQDLQLNRDTSALMKAFGETRVSLFDSSADMLDGIASGRQLIGYNVIGSYALERQAHNPAIGVVMPNDYTLVTSRVALIAREARHPNAAKLFLDFLLSGWRPRARQRRAYIAHRPGADRQPRSDETTPHHDPMAGGHRDPEEIARRASSSVEREDAEQQARRHEHRAGAERPAEGEALVVAQFDAGQADEQIGRGDERAEQMDLLPDQRGARHFHRGQAILTPVWPSTGSMPK
jgi:ABC-type Fe3+ transport system substrate-binding protein